MREASVVRLKVTDTLALSKYSSLVLKIPWGKDGDFLKLAHCVQG